MPCEANNYVKTLNEGDATRYLLSYFSTEDVNIKFEKGPQTKNQSFAIDLNAELTIAKTLKFNNPAIPV